MYSLLLLTNHPKNSKSIHNLSQSPQNQQPKYKK